MHPVLSPLAVEAKPQLEEVLSKGLTIWDVARAAVILVVAIALAQLVKALLARAVRRGDDELSDVSNPIGRFVGYLVVVGGLVYALSALDVRIAPLLGALGIGGIALAFALRDILENLLAGVLLQARRPFRRGEQIMTSGYEGTVEDVNLRAVVMRTFDGELVVVPNAMVLKAPIVNLTRRGIRRTTLVVGLDYDTDLERAKEIIRGTVRGVEGVRSRPAAEVFVQAFGEFAIDVAILFWHLAPVADLWRVRDAVAVAVKQALDREGIALAVPETVVSFRRSGPAAPPGIDLTQLEALPERSAGGDG
jgi:small conductance mechanosensitive channel